MELAPTPRATPESPFLPAATVMAIGGLTLRARCVADGVLAGLHRSRRQGESAEFAEHKVYAPGDDVRRVDWKAFGKLDRYYVKRFEEETSLSAMLVVDSSASMGYPEKGRHTKYQYAATLACALGYLLLHQSDAVGLCTFAAHATRRHPPRARHSHLHELVRALEATASEGTTDVRGALLGLREQVARHSFVVVISDLLHAAEPAGGVDAMLQGLKVLSARGADVALLHVLDPDELDLPFQGVVRFLDMESPRDLQVDAESIRESYREEVQAFVASVQRAAAAANVSYQQVRTDAPPAAALVELVASRLRARRV